MSYDTKRHYREDSRAKKTKQETVNDRLTMPEPITYLELTDLRAPLSTEVFLIVCVEKIREESGSAMIQEDKKRGLLSSDKMAERSLRSAHYVQTVSCRLALITLTSLWREVPASHPGAGYFKEVSVVPLLFGR